MADERTQKTVLLGSGCQFLLYNKEGEEVRKSSKKAICLAKSPRSATRGGDVLISSFLQPFTGGQGQNVSL